MQDNQQSRVKVQASFNMRDFLLLLSLLGVGSNLVWCWKHDAEIQQLKQGQQSSITAPVTLEKKRLDKFPKAE